MPFAAELQAVSKHYRDFKAVDEISLQINKGEVFGFLGPNGAGKSTTLRMMMSLIKPTSGSISILGMPLNTQREAIMRRIGCIIEKPDFYLHLSGISNLKLFGKLSGADTSSKNTDKILEWVQLKGQEKKAVQTYSHGMKQRLGLAQALLHNPDLIVLDEPTTGLDPQGIIDLRNLILQLKNEAGKTIVLSSHILSEIELIADSMVIINRGKAVVQGKVNELLSHSDLSVRIETDLPEQAIAVLSGMGFHAVPKSASEISLRCERSQIPDVNNALTSASIPVFRIHYTRSLEDYFLQITSDASNPSHTL